MDTVFIKGLTLYTLIGVYEFERVEKQRIIVDVEMKVDLNQACLSDNVKDTADYGKIAERLAHIAEHASYQLLEAIGHEMATSILNEFAVESLKLTINKPDILDSADGVGIVLHRP
jgi:dihydroneopterin aldolase